jgi:acetolactate synthase-1/2/3 large subunit
MHGIRSYVPKPVLNIDKVKEELINNAKKPFILFGQGIILGKVRIKSIR